MVVKTLALAAAATLLAAAPSLAQGIVPLKHHLVRSHNLPHGLLAEAAKKYECRDEVMNSGIVAYKVSAVREIWEIPCDRFAYNTSSVFVTLLEARPAQYQFVSFEPPPGRKRDLPFILINPAWEPRARTVSAFNKARGLGDCGTYEVHQATADGRFELVEYREKKGCDGKETAPEAFPLVYRKR